MALVKNSTLFQLALLGAGVAAAVYYGRKALTQFQDTAGAFTEPLAEGYVALTSGPGVQPLSKIQLPNGQRLELGMVKIGQDFTFTYGGIRYRVTGRNIDGNYDAVLVGT